MLADEGKLTLEDRVIDHLPWFRMADPYVTREMRVRDLLVHRSGLGLGAGDLLYWPTTTYSNREVAERLRDVPLTGGFRERYAYDNILYGIAQLVVEQASGQSYEHFLRTRIFQPLGMHDTGFEVPVAQRGRIMALTTRDADGRRVLADTPTAREPGIRLRAYDSGAGGLYSTAAD